MCGSEGTCVNIPRREVDQIQESIKVKIDQAIEYGRKEYTEEDCIKDTTMHINQVKEFINNFAIELLKRGNAHDSSKLKNPELKIFTEYTPKLAGCTYGSEQYQRYLKEMQKALKHHYKKNSHHPEHYKNGINDMSLYDIVEMLCDWMAAVMRHNDGNIYKSLEINKERFQIDDQLYNILKNTVDLMKKSGSNR